MTRAGLIRRAKWARVAASGAPELMRELMYERLHPPRRPPSASAAAADQASLSQSIDHGLRYLSRLQRDSGLLRGFAFVPGASTCWLTAHVALVLEGVPAADSICARAASYVARYGDQRGGFGWNRLIHHDADTTPQAIMLLHRYGLTLREQWFEFEFSALQPDGGFASFPDYGGPRESGWTKSHPEVTLVAIEMLRRLSRKPGEREAAEAWLAEQEDERGIVPSYWWSTIGYSLWAQARCGYNVDSARRIAEELAPGETRTPHLAMMVAAASADGTAGPGALAGAEALLSAQLRDGSWPCDPCLRLTDHRQLSADFELPSLDVVRDRRRIFSTAHAVAALHSVRTALTADRSPPEPAQLSRRAGLAGP